MCKKDLTYLVAIAPLNELLDPQQEKSEKLSVTARKEASKIL